MKNSASLELQTLLLKLKCKTACEEIPLDLQPTVLTFLKQEDQAQSSYRLARLLASSGMTKAQLRTFEQFNWDFNPAVPRQDINAFRSSQWIENAANLLLVGDVGIGKSHFAKALCYDAILRGFPAYFISAFDLIAKIKKSPQPANKIDFYGKSLRVLAVDEVGYTVYQKEDTDILFQIFSKRSELLPTIVTSNLAPKKWGTIFSGPAASAILDRLSFNGKFLIWDGPSFRPHGKNKR